jgi:hypothetical protein
MEELTGPLDLYISPFAYMNQMYSNMVENVHSQISISWSVYVQPNRDAIVIIQSEPAVIQISDWNINRGTNKTIFFSKYIGFLVLSLCFFIINIQSKIAAQQVKAKLRTTWRRI